MNFTPQQVRETLEISEETLRYWKRMLAPIRGRNGYQPCYSFQDLVALAVIGVLVNRFGVRIKTFAEKKGEAIFSLLSGPFMGIGAECMVFDSEDQRVRLVARLDDGTITSPSIVIPLRPVLEDLRRRLLEAGDVTPSQLPLALPPVGLPKAVRLAS